MLPSASKAQPGAVPIHCRRRCSPREHRLLLVVLRGGDPRAVKIPAYPFKGRLVHYEPLAEAPGYLLLGDIVVCRTETAGRDDYVRPSLRDLQGAPDPLRVVAHYGVKIYIYPEFGKPLRDDLRVGVRYVPEE